MIPRDGVVAPCVLGRLIVGRLVEREVGKVEAGPLAFLRVPPHVLLPLRPRLPVGIGGRAVVEDPLVRGPRPAPLGRDWSLLPMRFLARGLVLFLLEGAAVDPAAARGRAVVGKLLVPRERLPVRADSVDLAQHLGCARVLMLTRG